MGLFLEDLIGWLLQALVVVIFLNIVLSWLVAFDVVNLRNPYIRQFATFLDAVSRPVLAPFRRVIPVFGGFDITPLIAIVVISLVRVDLLPWVFGPIVRILGG